MAPNVSLAPNGIELRLAGVPIHVSAHALKAALVRERLGKLDYDFLVGLEKSSEELFWEQFDKAGSNRTNTAQAIIPNSFGSHNVGKALIGRTISVRCGKTLFKIHVTKIRNLEITKYKYNELRGAKLVVSPAAGDQDGTILSIERRKHISDS